MGELEFGRYRLKQLLGRGDAGDVWRAQDTETGRIVAVKVLNQRLSRDRHFRDRFRRELRAVAALTEPHVVPVHGCGAIHGRLFVDMRLARGRSLADVLAAGRLKPTRAVHLVTQAAVALDAAHDAGIVHGGVTPSNILVTGSDFVYLTGFGIGTSGKTSTESVHYTAPEQFSSSPPNARADVYALACVLYECVTGTPPFAGDDPQQSLTAHMVVPPPLPSRVVGPIADALDPVIAKGLAKDPRDRYPSAMALARAARDAVAPPGFEATGRFVLTPESESDAPAPNRSKLPLLVGAVALVGLLAATAIVGARVIGSATNSSSAAGEKNASSQSAPATGVDGAATPATAQTVADYLNVNGFSQAVVSPGRNGAPTIDLPTPAGWTTTQQNLPDRSYGGLRYTGPEANPDFPPTIFAYLSRLGGAVDAARVLAVAPNELRALPEFDGGDAVTGTLGGFQASETSGLATLVGATRFIAQKTVMIPTDHGLYMLQLNGYAMPDQRDIVDAALREIDATAAIGT